MLVVCNFTPVLRANYRVGVPRGGRWRELLNSDAAVYGGSGVGNLGGVQAVRAPAHGRPYSRSTLTLPPLACSDLHPDAGREPMARGRSGSIAGARRTTAASAS